MNTTQDIHLTLNQILQKVDQNSYLGEARKKFKYPVLPQFQPGTLTCIRSLDVQTLDALFAELKKNQGEGWCTYTDEIQRHSLQDLDEDRILLYGEWIISKTCTLSVRQSGGGWTIWYMEEQDPDQSSSHVDWISHQQYLQRPRGRFTYQICWRWNGHKRIPVASRLSHIETPSS